MSFFMGVSKECDCTCLLCATYGHEAVENCWWISHTEKCKEAT